MENSGDIPDKRIQFKALGFYLPFFVLLLNIWLASGTLAPYAASHHEALVLKPCRYLANIDHGVFNATFLFLDGAPAEVWQGNPLLRRIFYPLISYPFMKLLGFESGGFLTNIILHCISFFLFTRFLLGRVGQLGASLAAWILATYPGISYWVGLPYCYACIVPLTIISYMLLFKIQEHKFFNRELLAVFFLGVLFLGYDLFPYFAPILLFLMYRKRGVGKAFLALGVLLLPVISWNLIQLYLLKLPILNVNTAAYGHIISSYLHFTQAPNYLEVIKALPGVALQNFFYSNFLFLPAVWLLMLCALGKRFIKMGSFIDYGILLSALALFLFNNLAPEYSGWQLRGKWIARLYQPVFVVFIVMLAKVAHTFFMERKSRIVGLILFLGLTLGQALSSLGHVVDPRVADHLYYNFYQHSIAGAFEGNLKKFGIRPFGFCSQRRIKNRPSIDK